MNKDIESQIERAKELYKELEEEANSNLKSKEISDRTLNLTQEVILKMRHVFDQSMRCFFESEIKPNLKKDKIKKTNVYFPISKEKNGLDSILGMAKISDLNKTHPDFYRFLVSIQPYNSGYEWLNDLAILARDKHLRLTPQKRIETKRTTVSRGGAKVSWGSGVKFGSGVRVMGARVDSTTQKVIPTPGIDVKEETWVSFMFKDTNINSLGFCKKIINEGEKIIDKFFKLF